MKRAAIFSLIVLASIAVVKSDISDKALKYYFMSKAIMDNSQTCAPYGGDCTIDPCCQYYGREMIDCFNGVCLQAECGYPGQLCGTFIGECCYHLEMNCDYHDLWEGTCVSSRGIA